MGFRISRYVSDLGVERGDLTILTMDEGRQSMTWTKAVVPTGMREELQIGE